MNNINVKTCYLQGLRV